MWNGERPGGGEARMTHGSLVVQGGTSVVSCVGGTCPPLDVMGRARHLCGLPLPNPEPGLTIKKTSGKSQLRTF